MKRKITIRIQWIGILTVLIAGLAASAWAAKTPKPLGELQRDLVNLRFGMFIHLSPATYLDVADQLMSDHAAPRQGKDDILGTADDLSLALVNVSETPFSSDDPAALQSQPGVKTLLTKESPGYPTPYPVGARGRYVRVFSSDIKKISLGELEIFAEPEK